MQASAPAGSSNCESSSTGQVCLWETHPELHPLVEQAAVVEFTEQAGRRDAEGGGGQPAPPARHVTKEVVPEFSKQP